MRPGSVFDRWVLCFLLFAETGGMRLSEIQRQSSLIFAFAILMILLTVVFYGVLFYSVVSSLKLPLGFFQRLFLGSIVFPTDPIEAMSILRKIGFIKVFCIGH